MQMIRFLRRIVLFTSRFFYKLFDTQIVPMLLYGAEVWGAEN